MVAMACSSRPLSVTLLQPPSVPPDAGTLVALRFSLNAAWDGGQAHVPAQALGHGFSLDLPAGIPVDVEVDGVAPGAPPWRGEWHGTISSLASSSELSVLMLPVGFISSFPALSGLPALAGASATPLDPGRVLILGGIINGGVQQSAWIYDQSQVSFVPSAVPAGPRAHHLALPLGEGEVLLAGGDGEGTSLELYFPADGGTAMGSLSQSQLLPSGALVGTGRALLGCGRAPDGGLGASIGVDSWPDGGRLPISCSGGRIVEGTSGAVVISPSGVVLSIGLEGSETAFEKHVTSRTAFGAAADPQGGVLVVGGFDDAGVAMRLVEDIESGSLASGQLDTPRADAAVISFDGGYLVVGGVDETGNALASAQIIGGFALLSGGEQALSQPRHFAAATPIPGYRLILIISGQGTNAEPSGGLDLFATP